MPESRDSTRNASDDDFDEIDEIDASSTSVDRADDESMNDNDDDDDDDDDDADDTRPPGYVYEYDTSTPIASDGRRGQATKVEDAAKEVYDVLRKYGGGGEGRGEGLGGGGECPIPLLPSSLDPNDFAGTSWSIHPSSPWHDITNAFDEILSAGENLARAWNDVVVDDDGGGASSTEERSSIVRDENGDLDDGGSNIMTEEEEREYRMVYAEWSTNAFGDELDMLRRGMGVVGVDRGPSSSGGEEATTDVVDGSLDPTRFSLVSSTASRDGKGGRGGRGTQSSTSSTTTNPTTTPREIIDVRVLSDMLISGSDVLSTDEKRMLLCARRRGGKETTRRTTTKIAIRHDDDECVGPATTTRGLTLHERRKREIGFMGLDDL